jgi:hypothetical protein
MTAAEELLKGGSELDYQQLLWEGVTFSIIQIQRHAR